VLSVLHSVRNTQTLTESLLLDIWRTILRADARCFISFEHNLNLFPHRLLLSTDERRSDQLEIAQEFATKRLCCLGPYASEPMRVMAGPGATYDTFLGPIWQRRLRAVVHEVDGFISDLEDRHKRLRDDIIFGDADDTMCSKYLLREQKTLDRVYQPSEPTPASASSAPAHDLGSPRNTKWGGEFIYHLERCRLCGDNIADKHSWEKTHREFEQMSSDAHALYSQLALCQNEGADAECLADSDDEEDAQDFDGIETAPLPWCAEPRSLSVNVAEQEGQTFKRRYPVSPALVDQNSNMKPLAAAFRRRVSKTITETSLPPSVCRAPRVACQDIGACRAQ
jgi:hypothetical protein